MNQAEKDNLLEKFLDGALEENEVPDFEELVRSDDSFAREVALRLGEVDAFHRNDMAEKTEIKRRYRRQVGLRRLVWGSIVLLGLFCIANLGDLIRIGQDSENPSRESDKYTLLPPPLHDTLDIAFPFRKPSTLLQSMPPPCIRDTSWMRFISKVPIAGSGDDWESLLAAGKYQDALRASTAFISMHKDDYADYPYDCLGCGALNICMPSGDLELAIRCLDVVRNHVDYKSKRKNVATLLVLAYACNNECEKAKMLVQEEQIEYLLNDNNLKNWLSKCNGNKR